MNDPYRSAAIVPVVPYVAPPRNGQLMSTWSLEGRVKLTWTHGEAETATLAIATSRGSWAEVQLESDHLRELIAMAQRALDETLAGGG